MRLTDGTASARLTLAIDLTALVLFIAAGMRSHTAGTQAEVFLRNAVPVTVAWVGAAFLFRTYRPPTVPVLLKTWIIAVPIAVVIRSVWVGSPTGGRFLVFLGVALVFTLLLLAGGRVIAAVAGRRLRGTAPDRTNA